MSADRLLRHYDSIADAPDAVPRLRRFVLDLAVRGKLVPQDAKDEPSSELIKQIAKEKARLVKAGEIKREKPTECQIASNFEVILPAGWSLSSVSEITVCLDYRRAPVNGTDREARIEGKPQEALFPYYGATQQQGWIDEYIFEGEFVLLGEDGVSFHDPLRAKAYLITGKSWVNNHAHVFRAILISPRFLVLYLNVFNYAERIVGATRAKLNQAQAVTIPVPLPPLAEQRRIVAKVDELMALCDRLEAARASRENVRDRLATASLGRLAAHEATTFAHDVRLVLGALPALTARTNQLRKFRNTILSLAIRGKLAPQDANDEPASELVNRMILGRKKVLVKPKLNISCDYIFQDENHKDQYPRSWSLEPIKNLIAPGSTISYGVLVPGPHVEKGTPLVRAQDLSLTGHPSRPNKAISHEIEASYTRTRLKGGEILLCVVGSIGKIGIAPSSWAGFNIARAVARIMPAEQICRDYILLVLRSSEMQSRFLASTRTLAQPTLNISLLEMISVPLPPLAEQRRIVAKVDALMALCDRLEASLAAADFARARLLDALLAEALQEAEAPLLAAAE